MKKQIKKGKKEYIFMNKELKRMARRERQNKGGRIILLHNYKRRGGMEEGREFPIMTV